MAQETLNIVITADNKEAISNINQTINATNNLGESLKKMPDVTGKAALALNNLSRIAQDAPYGFMGISNNLNPLLESFQRLQKESGSTGNALKSMVALLSGPAGIGLAVGVASSLIVKFGDNIADFFSKLGTGSVKIVALGEELKKTSEFLKKIDEERGKTTESVAKEAANVEVLVAQYGKNNTTLQEREGIINKLKSVSPEYFGGLDKENTSIQQLNNSYQQYIGNLQQVITARLLEAELSKRIADRLTYEKEAGINLLKSGYRNPEYLNEQNAALKKWQSMIDAEGQIAKDIAKLSPKSIGAAIGPIDDTAMKQYQKDLEAYIRAEKDVIKPKKGMNTLDYELNQGVDPLKEKGPKLPVEILLYQERIDKFNKSIKDQEQSYKSFAKTLAGDVTNGLMSVFSAMEQGQNPLQAIGDMFANIAKQIAAAVIEATIFEALMNAFPELKGAFAAIGVVSKVTPFAEGGVVSSPRMGLVGEAGPEAIMPLSKLGSMMKSTFNAGAMSGGGNGGNGQFVLRGQDLLLSVNRAQKASNLKGQNISLA